MLATQLYLKLSNNFSAQASQLNVDKSSRQLKMPFDHDVYCQSKLEDLARQCGLAPRILFSTDWMSPFAKALRLWITDGSWVRCHKCGSAFTLPLTPAAINDIDGYLGRLQNQSKTCKRCLKGKALFKPALAEVPIQLQHLGQKARCILSPINLFTEYDRRQWGYRGRKGTLKLSWKDTDFRGRLALASAAEQQVIKEAYEYLMCSSTSTYKDWVKQHENWLHQGIGSRRLPLQTLAAVGVECAIWPDLYPFLTWCPSANRASTRKRAREESDSEDEVDHHESMKRAFAAQVFSENHSYASDYQLLQFVHDAWLYTTLTGAAASRLPIRESVAGKAFSPMFWRWKHLMLIDLQRQLGWPTLFWTKAPYEWLMPWPKLLDLLREQRNLKVLDCPAWETAHIAHSLVQTFKNAMAGAGDRWKNHLLSDKTDSSQNNVLAWAWRLEFQDGTRKHARQGYHGRGTMHLHALVWLRAMDACLLHHLVAASLPAYNNPLRPYVHYVQPSRASPKDLQLSKTSSSKVSEMTLERDSKSDALHLRCYFKDILAAFPSHEDLQWGLEGGMLLKYAAGYLDKHSDGLAKEIFEGQPDGWQMAKRVLQTWRPAEPQMWSTILSLQLSNHSGQSRRVNVPDISRTLGRCTEYIAYLSCEGRPADLSFYRWLHFFRIKPDGSTALYTWVQRKQKEDCITDDALQVWLLNLPLQGEVAVATRLLSPFNSSAYFAQWCVLHIPHQDEAALSKHLDASLPLELQWFSVAHAFAPALWGEPQEVRQHFSIEGFSQSNLSSLVQMCVAYVDALEKHAVKSCYAPPSQQSRHFKNDCVLTPVQKRHVDEVCQLLSDVRNAAEDSTGSNHAKCLAWTGPAGSGKSAVAKVLLGWCQKNKFVAEIVCPTGKLVSAYRTSFPELQVDTLHGRLKDGCVHVGLQHLVFACDILIVEEFGQIGARLGQQLMRAWLNAEKCFLILYVGDKCQLAPVAEEPFFTTSLWSKQVRERHFNALHRCVDSTLSPTLQKLRLWSLTAAELKKLVAGRKCGGMEPTVADVLRLMKLEPGILFVTWSLHKASWINDLILKHLYDEGDFLGEEPSAPVDDQPTSNISYIKIYKGLKVCLTMNANKRLGFVNGMGARVLEKRGRAYIVQTDLGTSVVVYKRMNEHGQIYYPWRLNFAINLSKIQGETIDKMALWLDVKGIPGAFYVGLSRVRALSDIYFLGHLTTEHVVPSKYVSQQHP
jgi:hypothetical protein